MGASGTVSAQARLQAASVERAQAAPQSNNGFYLEAVTEIDALLFPTGLAVAPSGRLYVIERGGGVRVVSTEGEVSPRRLVDLNGEVYIHGDRGLTGIALHPSFPETSYVYLFYSVDDDPTPRPESGFRGYSRLTRYTIDETGKSVVPGSRRVLLGKTAADGPSSCYNSHASGTLHFGHDGSLLVSHGDGASWAASDTGGLYPECFEGTDADLAEDLGSFRAQTVTSLSGKILRLDPETGQGLPDNPFWTGNPDDDASRVWALGLRNPFRFAVAPTELGVFDGPGELIVGDVGTGYFEELNRVGGGENFGWPCFEGPRIQPDFARVTPPPGMGCSAFEGELTRAFAYIHHFIPDASAPAGRTAFSITGGTFYPGTSYPERYQGMLFYADYSARWISAGRIGPDGLEASEPIIDDAGAIVDIAYDPVSDALLAVDIQKRRVVRLRNSGDGPTPPVARGRISERYGELGHTVTFSDNGSYDPEGGALSYRWSFGFGDGADSPNAVHSYYQTGDYIASLAVTNASGLTSISTFPIAIGETLPEVSIVEPKGYVIPETGRVSLQMEASDRSGEAVEAFWEVDLVHNLHVHASFLLVDGASGSVITQPHAASGEVAFYRARAVGIDGEGLRVERARTLRVAPPEEIDLGALAQEGKVQFSHPIEVGRIALPVPLNDEQGLQVETLENGAWKPVRYPHILAEGDTTQILFAPILTEAIRVVGHMAVDSIGVFAHVAVDADLPDRWDPVDAGGGVGRTVPFGDRGLLLVGTGSIPDGSFHAVRQPFPPISVLTARLDAINGADQAVAGLTVRRGLAQTDSSLSIGMTQGGSVRVWQTDGVTHSEREVFQADGAVWLRARRIEGGIEVEASKDSLAWVSAASMNTEDEVAWVAGPMVAGGDRAAAAWFDVIESIVTVVEPPEADMFTAYDVYPNPGPGLATFRMDAGKPGTYEAIVLDVRGRVVRRLEPMQVETPRRIRMEVPRQELAPGSYIIRVRHIESGDVRVLRFVTTH